MNVLLKDIVIYGAGGLGREILSLIKRDYSDVWRVIGFIDDAPNLPSEIDGVKLLSKDILDSRELSVVLGFADPKLKAKVFKDLSRKKNISFPNIISRSAVVNKDLRIGNGVVITDFCWISTNVTINNAVFLNVGVTVGHDAVIEDFCSIMPQCAISGYVRVGSETLVGAKSFVLQQKTIGRQAVIAAGSAVFVNVEDNQTVWGNPSHTLIKSQSREK